MMLLAGTIQRGMENTTMDGSKQYYSLKFTPKSERESGYGGTDDQPF